MNALQKQHLIDPEICIRCYSCEAACPVKAISHNDANVVVDAASCNFCMDCIPVCPTGSIDEWRVVQSPYSLEEQLGWAELPKQAEFAEGSSAIEALDDSVAALLEAAHQGAGGRVQAPPSAAKPTINLYTLSKPAEATVQGNYRLTSEGSDSDVRHIILDFGGQTMPVLEGQSIGIIPPGTNADGKSHLPRLYSISSPRDGERPNFNNLSLTVKRDSNGLCSNYVCDLKQGDKVKVTGPFGATFLLPGDPNANLLMICTGTGSAPFRGFTMRRQRENFALKDRLTLIFGARTPDDLPYFGPLTKIPDSFLKKVFAFSRAGDQPKMYVQDQLRNNAAQIAALLSDPAGHIYICGKRAMEQGVEEAFADIARAHHLEWQFVKSQMRESGRYHVETY
jgi:benzoyl-CoA 2,3-epoxidase subunit A